MPRKKPRVTLGQRIRAARKATGWTQTELAIAARTSQDHVSDIERDAHVPGIRMLYRLAAALGANPGELLGEG